MDDQGESAAGTGREPLGPQAWLLRRAAIPWAVDLLDRVAALSRISPWRQMMTPGGRQMSVATTNCGPLGWISDRAGYRYTGLDPLTGQAWPAMPPLFKTLATRAAAEAGFDAFQPDACLINRYRPGVRLSLHQDRDEQRFDAPIVSVSLGLPAIFLFGGLARRDPCARVALRHGDVVVWGGVDRLRFHGVLPVKPRPATASLFDEADAARGRAEADGDPAGSHVWDERINLTFRLAGR